MLRDLQLPFVSLLLAGASSCAGAQSASVGASPATSSRPLEGVLVVSEFIVPADTEIVVTSDLEVHATGIIRIDGSLRAADRSPGSSPQDAPCVLLKSVTGIVVTGTIIGGRGGDGRTSIQSMEDLDSVDRNGGRGSDIVLDSSLCILDGQVRAGDGGTGGPHALGGHGGHVFVTGNAVTSPDAAPKAGGYGGAGGTCAQNIRADWRYGQPGTGGNALVLNSTEPDSGVYFVLKQATRTAGAREGAATEDHAVAPPRSTTCPAGEDGPDGARMEGGEGGLGTTGPNGTQTSPQGGPGGPGGPGGVGQGGNGVVGSPGSDCCPDTGGKGGKGGDSGKGKGGKGGKGGTGGNGLFDASSGTFVGPSGPGGPGGTGGNGLCGTAANGGPGGRKFGEGGERGLGKTGDRGEGGMGGDPGAMGAGSGGPGATGPEGGNNTTSNGVRGPKGGPCEEEL